jgi:nucleotide-binding universal stress UspA family protein
MEESAMLLKDNNHKLSLLKQHLENKAETISYNPTITCMEQAGTVLDVVNSITHDKDIGLVIIGTHGNSGLSTLLLGNHSRSMIDEINKPLLLVPPGAKIAPVKKIAFATDFQDPAYDLDCIVNLITLAMPLNAEILVVNIFHNDRHTHEVFMQELTARVNYPLLYYRLVKAYKPEAGLDWLYEHGQIDILAMVHRDHTFIDSLFRGSFTQKMANHIPVPLLVYPAV